MTTPTTEAVSVPPDTPSGLRITAKTCHLLALAWTVFCGASLVEAWLGLSATRDLTGQALILSVLFWGFVWAVPVVTLEVIAVTTTTMAKARGGSPRAGRREWQLAWIIAALPLLVLAGLVSLQVVDTLSAAQRRVANHTKTGVRVEATDTQIVLYNYTNERFAPCVVTMPQGIGGRVAILAPHGYARLTRADLTSGLDVRDHDWARALATLDIACTDAQSQPRTFRVAADVAR